MRKWRSLAVTRAVIIVAACSAPCHLAQARPRPPAGKVPDALVDQWRALEKLDDSVKSYRVKRKLETIDKQNSKTRTAEYLVRRGPGYRLQTGTQQETKRAAVVAVAPASRFILEEGDGGKWLLRGFETGPAADGADGGKEYPYFPLSASAERVSFADDAVAGRIRPTATTRQDDGRTKIDFDYIPDPKHDIVGRGSLVYDEAAGGVVHDYRAAWKLLDGGSVSRTVTRTFFPLAPGRTVPEVRTVREVEAWENDRSETTYEFSDYDYGPLREEEFRLSHYGLPEPSEGEPTGRTRYEWWLFGATAAFATVAVALRSALRRRKA